MNSRVPNLLPRLAAALFLLTVQPTISHAQDNNQSGTDSTATTVPADGQSPDGNNNSSVPFEHWPIALILYVIFKAATSNSNSNR